MKNPSAKPTPVGDLQVRAVLRQLADRMMEDILIDLAEGQLDNDPAAKAEAEELVRTDAKAREFYEQYCKGLALASTDEAKAEAQQFVARFWQKAGGEEFADEPEPAVFREESLRDVVQDPLAQDPARRWAAKDDRPLPDQIDVSSLLPGFTGFAHGSVRRPGEATVLTFSRAAKAGEDRPGKIVAVWQGGKSESHEFLEHFGRWMAEIEIDLPWAQAVAIIEAEKLAVQTAG